MIPLLLKFLDERDSMKIRKQKIRNKLPFYPWPDEIKSWPISKAIESRFYNPNDYGKNHFIHWEFVKMTEPCTIRDAYLEAYKLQQKDSRYWKYRIWDQR